MNLEQCKGSYTLLVSSQASAEAPLPIKSQGLGGLGRDGTGDPRKSGRGTEGRCPLPEAFGDGTKEGDQ